MRIVKYITRLSWGGGGQTEEIQGGGGAKCKKEEKSLQLPLIEQWWVETA